MQNGLLTWLSLSLTQLTSNLPILLLSYIFALAYRLRLIFLLQFIDEDGHFRSTEDERGSPTSVFETPSSATSLGVLKNFMHMKQLLKD